MMTSLIGLIASLMTSLIGLIASLMTSLIGLPHRRAVVGARQELNRRIYRFTYRPESVRELPNSAWSTPPHFANADEQANLNDIIVTALNGRETFSAGVEFYEALRRTDRTRSHAPLIACGSLPMRL